MGHQNPLKILQRMVSGAPTLIGKVVHIYGDGRARVELLGGALIIVQMRVSVILNHMAFVKDGAIVGEAPTLPTSTFTV